MCEWVSVSVSMSVYVSVCASVLRACVKVCVCVKRCVHVILKKKSRQAVCYSQSHGYIG